MRARPHRTSLPWKSILQLPSGAIFPYLLGGTVKNKQLYACSFYDFIRQLRLWDIVRASYTYLEEGTVIARLIQFENDIPNNPSRLDWILKEEKYRPP